MFRITNTSARVVGIAGELMMPDDVRVFPDSAINTSAVDALVRLGILRSEREVEQAAAPVAPVEDIAEAPVEKPKKPRKPRAKKTEKVVEETDGPGYEPDVAQEPAED